MSHERKQELNSQRRTALWVAAIGACTTAVALAIIVRTTPLGDGVDLMPIAVVKGWAWKPWYSKAESATRQCALAGAWASESGFFHADAAPPPVFRSEHDIDEGVAAFSRVVGLWKEGEQVSQCLLWIGELHMSVGEHDRAIKAFSRIREIPRASPHHLVAAAIMASNARVALGRPEAALAGLDEFLCHDDVDEPFRYPVYSWMARLHESRGELQRAAEDYRRLQRAVEFWEEPSKAAGRASAPRTWDYLWACREIERLERECPSRRGT